MVGSNGTFAYINLFSSPSLASESATALSRISEVGIDGYGRLEIYLSLNGNRISTCYFLWEDFLDCCSPPRARRDRTAREKGGHGGGSSGRIHSIKFRRRKVRRGCLFVLDRISRRVDPLQMDSPVLTMRQRPVDRFSTNFLIEN